MSVNLLIDLTTKLDGFSKNGLKLLQGQRYDIFFNDLASE